MFTTHNLSLVDTKIVLDASMDKAKEIGVDMNIAVVDSSGLLLGFYRMDNAKFHSINIAIDKAFTASGTRTSTSRLSEVCLPGEAAFGVNTCVGGRMVVIGGGVPIEYQGNCLGGVGCASGNPDQDEEVAQAGIDSLKSYLEGKNDKS